MSEQQEQPSEFSKTKLFKGANVYAVVGERKGEEWGVSIGLEVHKGQMVIEVRFGVLVASGSNPHFKFFTDRSGDSVFQLVDGSPAAGRRLNKIRLLFSDKPVPRLQFIALADQHEVWEKLESWIISAFASEGVSPIFGIDIAKLLRQRFEFTEQEGVNVIFTMPDLIGFTQVKAGAEAAAGDFVGNANPTGVPEADSAAPSPEDNDLDPDAPDEV